MGVKEMVKALREVKSVDDFLSLRISVTVSHEDNVRLQYLAKLLGLTRAGLAAKLLSASVEDTEQVLGLNPFDASTDYGKYFLERCTGKFEQTEEGLFRVLDNGEKVKVSDGEE